MQVRAKASGGGGVPRKVSEALGDQRRGVASFLCAVR